MSVDFPAPLGPKKPMIPGPSFKLKLRNPHTLRWYCLLTLSTTSSMIFPLFEISSSCSPAWQEFGRPTNLLISFRVIQGFAGITRKRVCSPNNSEFLLPALKM